MIHLITIIYGAAYKFFVNCCTSEYQLKLEEFKYSSKLETYCLYFRVRSQRIIQEFDVKKLFFDINFLKLMHPYDAYMVGVIYGMYKNRVKCRDNIIVSSFNQYSSYIIMNPTLLIDTNFLDNTIDYIILKLKYGNKRFKISIVDICKKEFLFHGVGNLESCKLGFFISEKFIAEMV